MLEIIFIVSSVLGQDSPLSPLWPNVFWQNFSETTQYNGIAPHFNLGTFYYNYYLPAYRIDRDNGRYDRYCGLTGPYANIDTPCTHIVVNGYRYLYYPAQNTCCYCCNATSGCGVVVPTWMSGAIYYGQEVHNGYQTYKWEVVGGQPNFIYETISSDPANRITVSLYQIPDDNMDFSLTRSGVLPDGVFNLPNICTLANTCNYGFCQVFREGTFS